MPCLKHCRPKALPSNRPPRAFLSLRHALKNGWRQSSVFGLLFIQSDWHYNDETSPWCASRRCARRQASRRHREVQRKRATVQALIGNLVERGLDPAVPHLFIIDGSKALSKAIRATFGRDAAIQRCQIHKARTSGPPAEIDARPGETHIAAGLEMTTPQGETLLRKPRSRLEKTGGRFRLILEGSTRCSRNKAGLRGTAAFARLHEHHRERHGTVRLLPEREILALASMALRWTAPPCRNRQGFRPQGLQTASAFATGSPRRQERFIERHLVKTGGCVGSQSATPLRAFNIKWDIAVRSDIPEGECSRDIVISFDKRTSHAGSFRVG